MNFNEQETHSPVVRPDWLGDDWHDTSWHNDALPHATLYLTPDESGSCVEIWINYPDTKDREVPCRYLAVFQVSSVYETGQDLTLYSGNEEQSAQMFACAAEIAKTIIADCLKESALLKAGNFSELHDLCDANVLGIQERVLTDAGFTGENNEQDDRARNATFDVLNQAQAIADLWLRSRRRAQ